MASNLPPPPRRAKFLTPDGFMAPAWDKWITDLFARIGGLRALTNIEIEEQIDGLPATVVQVSDTSDELSDLTDEVEGLLQGPAA